MVEPSLAPLVKGSLTSHRTIASTEEREPMTQMSKDGQIPTCSEQNVRARALLPNPIQALGWTIAIEPRFLLKMHPPPVMRVSPSGKGKSLLLF